VQSVAWGLSFGLPQIQRSRNRRDNQRGVIERRQGDERYAIRDHIRGFSRCLDGEARLTNAAYPREREQSNLRTTQELSISPKSRSRPKSGEDGAGRADLGTTAEVVGTPLRLGTADKREARSSSDNANASARALPEAPRLDIRTIVAVYSSGTQRQPRSKAHTRSSRTNRLWLGRVATVLPLGSRGRSLRQRSFKHKVNFPYTKC
jgi:hypothetical protein